MSDLSPQRMKLGLFLRRRRAMYGLTLAQMALRLTDAGCRVSGESLSRWENESYIPRLSDPTMVRIIARCYGVSPSELGGYAGLLDIVPLGELDEIVKKLPPRLLNLLDEASPKEIELITRLVIAVLGREE